MGFTPKRHVYVLEFDDPDLDGLEVRAVSADLGTFLELTALAEIGDNPSAADIGKVGDLLVGFAKVLRSWNVTDDAGQDVPATVDGLKSLEFPFVFAIVAAWIKATAGVATPLASGSSGGGPSAELSTLPVELLSGSLAS